MKNLLPRLVCCLGILIGVGVLLLTTFQDSKDLAQIVAYNTPNFLTTDQRFKAVKEQILDRPLYMDPDSFNWIYNATAMVKNHQLRTRFTDSDNAPYGREVHWSNAFTWYLIALGKVNSLWTGDDLISSIEQTGRFANALLLGLFGIFWATILARKVNPLLAGLFPLTLVLFGVIRAETTFGYADHHALQLLLTISQMLAIAIGGGGFTGLSAAANDRSTAFASLQPPTVREAHKWFFLAALFGACGLWVGATQQAVIIALIGAGGAISLVWWRLTCSKGEKPNRLSPAPEVWRWWGISGGLLSVVLYLVEYFPSNLAMRLEVNHPLYALAWAGGAEIVYRICSLIAEPGQKKANQAHHLRAIIPAAVAVLLLPAAMFFGQDSWHFIHDGVTTRTHQFILEFAPIFAPRIGANLHYFAFGFGLFLLCPLIGVVYLCRKSTDTYHKLLLYQLMLVTIALTIASLFQERWSSFLAVSLIALFVVLTSTACRPCSMTSAGHRQRTLTILAIALFLLPQWFLQIHLLYLDQDESSRFMRRYHTLPLILLSREIAINLKFLSPDTDNRVLCENSFGPMLAYFGTAHSVGSLYWENRQGLHDYAAFWSAYSDEEAHAIVRQRGITHVGIQLDSDHLARRAQWIFRGIAGEDDIQRTFAYRLAYTPLNHPKWLEPFPLVYGDLLKREKVVFLRVKGG